MKKKRVGIIGCGAIGSRIASYICKELKNKAVIVSLCDKDYSRPQKLLSKLKIHAWVDSVDNLIKKSDFVIESASADISCSVAKKAVSSGRDVFIMSIGGLLNNNGLFSLARKKKCNIYLPSGAICGLDGLKAASMGKIRKVILSTYKPTKSLEGAPYLNMKRIDLKKIKEERLIFKGSALQAVKYFPKNINVSAILSLAGLGANKTEVRIVVDPKLKRNVHKVTINSDSGKIITETQNIPCPDNPKTSFLAVLSALATLKCLFNPVKIGT